MTEIVRVADFWASGVGISRNDEIALLCPDAECVKIFRKDGKDGDWALRTSFKTSFRDPSKPYMWNVAAGIVFSNGEIFVSPRQGSIQVYRQNDQCLLRQFEIAPNSGFFTVVDDHVFVPRYHKIQVFRTDGTFLREWELSPFEKPTGAAVFGDEIFITDASGNRVLVFGLDGTFLRTFGERLAIPSGIAVSPEGEVLVADWFGVHVFSPHGFWLRYHELRPLSSTLTHHGIAIAENGLVVICDPILTLPNQKNLPVFS